MNELTTILLWICKNNQTSLQDFVFLPSDLVLLCLVSYWWGLGVELRSQAKGRFGEAYFVSSCFFHKKVWKLFFFYTDKLIRNVWDQSMAVWFIKTLTHVNVWMLICKFSFTCAIHIFSCGRENLFSSFF